MSGWDAPPGSWDWRQEHGESGQPDEQGRRQDEPTGGYRALADAGGRFRAGRRGLPGYDEAQNYDPLAGFDHRTSYRQAPAYGQESAFSQAPGYGQESAFSQAPGYGQESAYSGESVFSREPVAGTTGTGQPGYRPATADQRDYRSAGYGQAEYRQGGHGQAPGSGQAGGHGQAPGSGQAPGYGQDYGPAGYSQLGHAPQDYASQGYAPPSSPPGHFPPADFGGHGQPDYGERFPLDAYGPRGSGGSAPDSRLSDAYRQDAYQAGFASPGVQDYDADSSPPAEQDDDGPASPGARPVSRAAQRSPRRLVGVKMVLYLAAAVVSVVVIVLLVVQLTRTGASSPAKASSSPSAGTAGTPAAQAGNGTTVKYVFSQAQDVGKYPLNKPVTSQFTPVAENRAAPVAAQIKARGAGRPGHAVVGIYDLGTVHSVTSSAYKGLVFMGYNGTFNPKAVIKLERSLLVSSRVVDPGPHGGQMVCGYDTSSGSAASECVWVTATTFGQVEFVEGATTVKYPGASRLALDARAAVESPAS
jgi:hypothetical protein